MKYNFLTKYLAFQEALPVSTEKTKPVFRTAKYGWQKAELDSSNTYDIFYEEGEQTTFIANTDTAEKADFLCKAANAFRYDEPGAITGKKEVAYVDEQDELIKVEVIQVPELRRLREIKIKSVTDLPAVEDIIFLYDLYSPHEVRGREFIYAENGKLSYIKLNVK